MSEIFVDSTKPQVLLRAEGLSLGCAVVVVGGAERAVGGTLCWRHLVLLVEMEEWMFWSGTVGAMGGTVDWGHGADCDGGGRWELAMDVLWGAVGAWW